MRTSRVLILSAVLAVTALASMPAQASVPYAIGNGWESVFMSMDEPGPYGGWGGAWDHPYTFSLADPGYLRITDYYMAGDYFRVWNGVDLLLETPMVAVDPMLSELDIDAAYANPSFSSAYLSLAPGTYELYFQDMLMVDGVPPDGYEAASMAFRVDPIPEPGTLLLLGSSLLATALVIRRRRR